jgi:hypothetical protein
MNRRRAVVAAAAVLLLTLAAAWGIEAWGRATPAADAYAVRVTRKGQTLRAFTVSDLEALGTHREYMQDQWQEGPRLLEVLSASKITSFARVTVIGLGARDAGRLDLERPSIDDRVLLDVAKRGTVKVCGPDIPYEKRVRDVIELAVE